MDRTEFLQNIFAMFPQNFNEFNVKLWKQQYENHLSEYIDYDELNLQFMNYHKSMSSAPTPTDLRDIARSLNLIHRPQKHTDYKPTKCAPPPPEFYEHWAKLKEKLAMKGAIQ